MTPGGGWLVQQLTAGTGELHQPWPAPEARARRTVRRCGVAGPAALVLGSSQSLQTVDQHAVSAAGMEVLRRRSGGGAVVVAPGAQLWFDVWIPRLDPLWQDDVVAGAFWLGDVWAAALRALAVEEVSVHRARAEASAWSALVCFAGMGPGEVSAGDRKVVGLSQRRNADGTLLHTMALLRWDPVAVPALLALAPDERRRASLETESAAAGLAELESDRLVRPEPLEAMATAVLDHLPDRQPGR